MSRLYDALKDARSSRRSANGNIGDGIWEALGIHGATPEALDHSDKEAPSIPYSLSTNGLEVVPPDEDLHAVSTPLHGSLGIPVKVALDPRARLIPHSVNPEIVEHYRKLRTKIIQQQTEKPFRSVVVTSASPQEGKTLTVLNLALSFAMLPSFRVLMVDGDMRRGTLGSWLGLDDNLPGLSNLMDGSAELEDVVLKSEDINIHLMLRGNSRAVDLHASQLSSHIQAMSEQFDLILVDSPPVNVITDVQVLAASCDAVLLIAKAFSTTRKAFEKAAQDLSPFRVIGTVLNAGSAHHPRYYGYY